MADTTHTDIIERADEDDLRGHESRFNPKPEWRPRYPGSGRLAGKMAIPRAVIRGNI